MGIGFSKASKIGIAAATSACLLGAGGAAAQGSDYSRWKYTIAPYFWGTSIDGSLTVGQRTVDASADFGDLVEFTDSAGALRFEAIKRWGLFGDVWFAKLSDKEDTPVGKAEISFDQTILEAGALYAFRPDFVGYLGARRQDLDGDIKVPIVGKQDTSESWTDAIVGVRYTPALGHRWVGVLRGDVGTGDSDFTWLGQVGIGYRFTDSVSGQIGYRRLDTDLEQGNFKWDLAQEGFGLGLVFQF